jgi:hypothetical protein
MLFLDVLPHLPPVLCSDISITTCFLNAMPICNGYFSLLSKYLALGKYTIFFCNSYGQFTLQGSHDGKLIQYIHSPDPSWHERMWYGILILQGLIDPFHLHQTLLYAVIFLIQQLRIAEK